MSQDGQIILIGIGLIIAGVYFIDKSNNNRTMQKWSDETKLSTPSWVDKNFYSKEFTQTHTFLGGLLCILTGLFALISRTQFLETNVGQYSALLFIAMNFIGFPILYFYLMRRSKK